MQSSRTRVHPSLRAVAAVGLGLALAPASATADGRRGSESYSVMTYNIGGKPGYTGYALDNGSSCDERARQIAAQIIAMPVQPDILVFAEATGECYKDKLIELLNDDGNGPYRSFIRTMGDGAVRAQDSGLMFFSKFPWTVPGVAGCAEPSLVGEQLNPVGQPHFGQAEGDFWQYSDLAFSDRLMAKGIGYACVTNPTTHQAINVFFTHNQSNYWTPTGNDLDDFAHDEREVNMKEASQFIEQMAPASITSKLGEAVIFAGDMNIMGNDLAYWINQEDGVFHQIGGQEVERVVRPSEVGGFQEYADLIGDGGLLATANGLRDPWRLEGTRDPLASEFDHWGDGSDDMGFVYDPAALADVDMGFTWDAHRNGQTDGDEFRTRLDYILDRQVKFAGNNDCYQHMTVERGFKYTANSHVEPAYVGMDLSDHYPLRAVIGPLEPQCSPSIAPIDALGTTPVNVAHAGARKWFSYTAPGTYVFDAVTSADLELHIYAASDLSTDLAVREGDTTIATGQLDRRGQNDPVTVAVDGPFYVMVAFKDPNHTGSYSFKARKNNCATWDQAMWIDPFKAVHVELPAIPTMQTKCYFKIKQDETVDGTPVEVHVAAVVLNQDWTPATASLALYPHDAPSQANPVADELVAATPWSTELASKLSASPDFRYLVLDRSAPAPTQAAAFDLVWTRNVTTVDVTRFTVVNQDDVDGGDEVKIFWTVDDRDADVQPFDSTSHTANGPGNTLMTYYYDGVATGGTSDSPDVECPFTCAPIPQLVDSHHMNISFPDALWGIAWEIDDSSPDDPLYKDGIYGTDGRFRIDALDPDPWLWINPGDAAPALDYAKNLWADFFGYSHGYRLEATRHLTTPTP